jgi:hypothetical protein
MVGFGGRFSNSSGIGDTQMLPLGTPLDLDRFVVVEDPVFWELRLRHLDSLRHTEGRADRDVRPFPDGSGPIDAPNRTRLRERYRLQESRRLRRGLNC